MNNPKKDPAKLTLFALVWPIFIESLLRILFGNVDTFMLSAYSDNSVAGVGAANQFVSIIILMFQVVSSGCTIIISQYLGAENKKRASDVALVSIGFNMVLGIITSIFMFVFSGSILKIMNFEQDIYNYSKEFLTIIGSFSFIQALSITVSAILRSYGLVRYPMYVNMGANILNIFGNSIFIYGLFGVPVLGVRGVAIATVASQLIGLVAIILVLVKNVDMGLSIRKIYSLPINIVKEVLRDIFKIGGPSAGESLSYNVSQIVITAIIGTMGAYALTARVYVFNLMLFIMLASMSIGQGTQIIIGRLVGAEKMDEAYKTCIRSLKIAIAVSFSVAILFAVLSRPLLGLFTDDPRILSVGSMLLLVTIVLEPGRAFNIVLGYSLKGTGDAKFILILGLIFMWVVAVFMSYILGIRFNLGLLGVWIAFALDEWIRGIFMLVRWKSRVWENLSLTKPVKELVSVTEL
ncbi:MAG: Multidrug resistance protein NorM [Firmicutes bacterium ADurb.Bin419]|nr:MAG: Multidrug resistance protein NorM [Firmicutes bacterium ADurb.Bin419]